jgi:hypothetical protein
LDLRFPLCAYWLSKPDKDGKPHRAKSRIVVLGNHEDRYWSKSQRYAPVLKYTSLRLLASKAVECKRILQRGDCKNAFCQAYLPDDECTVVRPPVGDPGYAKDEYWLLKKTLYGLRRSPHHWYNMFTKILTEMGLKPSPHDPCVYTGVVNPGEDYDPATSTRKLLHIGIYVDDFVFFSEDSAEEELFRTTLASKIKVDFMGDVDYFLGTAFMWKRWQDGHLSVHMGQNAFVEYLGHRFALTNFVPVPNMTPYRSGLPIDAIPSPNPKEPDFKRRRKLYQSIVGCINWLAVCTRPDVSPALTFLASYSTAPHIQHYKAALHVVKYLISTADYGISFHSNAGHTTQAYNHFPAHHDREAYTDAIPPSPAECSRLTGFTDACWGGQFGNAVPEGTPLELFKFRSLSGYLICRSGGPIAWKSIRQNQTSRSSCEAEITAMDACVVELLAVRHLARDLHLSDADDRTTIFNDNKSAVDWSSALTNKGTKHLNLHETAIRENVQNKTVKILHIPGKINASDLFTKELKDDAHFRRCRDTFMVSKANFLKHGHCVPAHLADRQDLPFYSFSALEGEIPASKENVRPKRTYLEVASAARTIADRPSSSASERGVTVCTDALTGDRQPLARKSSVILRSLDRNLIIS